MYLTVLSLSRKCIMLYYVRLIYMSIWSNVESYSEHFFISDFSYGCFTKMIKLYHFILYTPKVYGHMDVKLSAQRTSKYGSLIFFYNGPTQLVQILCPNKLHSVPQISFVFSSSVPQLRGHWKLLGNCHEPLHTLGWSWKYQSLEIRVNKYTWRF